MSAQLNFAEMTEMELITGNFAGESSIDMNSLGIRLLDFSTLLTEAQNGRTIEITNMDALLETLPNRAVLELGEPRDSILNNITCVEKVDPLRCLQIMYSEELPFVCKKFEDVAGEKAKLFKYFQKYDREHDAMKITYKRKEGISYGRCNPENNIGMFNTTRKVRHELCKELYIDTDITNCHPVMQLQLLQKAGAKDTIQNLQNYCENREQGLLLVMAFYECDRESAKMLFLALLNGGWVNAWMKKNDIRKNNDRVPNFLVRFNQDAWKNAKIIEALNPELAKQVLTVKFAEGKEYVANSTLAYWCQEHEMRCVEAVVKMLQKKKIIAVKSPSTAEDNNNNTAAHKKKTTLPSIVLCADGMMIEKKAVDEIKGTAREKILRLLMWMRAAVLELPSGLDLEFTVKEMVHTVNCPEAMRLPTFKYNMMFPLTSSRSLADLMILTKGKNYCKIGSMLYVWIDGKWRRTELAEDRRSDLMIEEIKIVLDDFIERSMARLGGKIAELEVEEAKKQEVKKGKKAPESPEMKKWTRELAQLNRLKDINLGTAQGQNCVVTQIWSTIRVQMPQKTIFDLGDEFKYCLQFNNGIFDILSGTFRKRVREDLVSVVMPHDWKPREEVPAEAFAVVEDFFLKLQKDPEDRFFIEQYLAHCMTGDNKLQMFLWILGASAANSKTTMKNIFTFCFPIYCAVINSNLLMECGLSKVHKELIILTTDPVRMLFVEECPENKKINAELVNQVTGGGNLRCEIMYSTSKEHKHQSHLTILSNHQPPLDLNNNGLLRRCKILHFDTEFVDERQEDDFENYVFSKDYHLEENFEKNDDLKLAFFYHLLGRYDRDFRATEKSAKLAMAVAVSKDMVANAIRGCFINYADEPEKGFKYRKGFVYRTVRDYLKNVNRVPDISLVKTTDDVIHKVLTTKLGFVYKPNFRYDPKDEKKGKGCFINLEYIVPVEDHEEPSKYASTFVPPRPSNKKRSLADLQN